MRGLSWKEKRPRSSTPMRCSCSYGRGIPADYNEGDFGESVIYNDYQLSRFAEDLLSMTPFIAESVPEELYDAADTMERDLQEWKGKHSDLEDGEYGRFLDEAYDPLSEWFYGRCMNFGHLKGGPLLWFIRCGGRIKILWDSDIRELWRCPQGIYEMRYADFAAEVSRFVTSFLSDMDAQTKEAAGAGIPGVYVDGALTCENRRRREIFSRQLEHLYAEDAGKTDWKRITDLYERMRRETGKRKE
ncbi:MAG: hypothetical protein II189_10640 [Lachnospiraceae bacterium]|nr:hypothetical protein [Lachnospiraceae bacterium]